VSAPISHFLFHCARTVQISTALSHCAQSWEIQVTENKERF
jgi:hypothetical protein